MVRVALLAPVPTGEKTTWTWQESPLAMERPEQVLPVTAN